MSALLAAGWARSRFQSVSVVPMIQCWCHGMTNSRLDLVRVISPQPASMRSRGTSRWIPLDARTRNDLAGCRPVGSEHLGELVDPHAGGVDHRPGADVDLPARLQVAHPDPGHPAADPARRTGLVGQEAHHPGAAGHRGSEVGGGPGQHHGVPGVVHLSLVERDRAADHRRVAGAEQLDRLAPAEVPQTARHPATGTHHVVDPDAQTRVRAVDAGPQQRVDEPDRLGQVRRQGLQRELALLQRLEDEPEVELLQVAQTRRGTAWSTGSRCRTRSRAPRPARPSARGSPRPAPRRPR